MKKLMTAFAGCMIAGFLSAAVESQNIVGYQTLAGNTGFTVVAPTFVTVGGVSQQLTFSSIQGAFTATDNLQFFNAAGDVTTTVYWLDDTFGVATGWYAEDFSTSLADQTVPAGTAFFVSMAAGGNIVMAGQVEKAAVTVTAVSGFTAVGNARPYDITFGDLASNGLTATDNIQFFNEAGDVIRTVYWLDDSFGVAPGWYAEDFSTSVAADPIAAGQGFFLSCAADGATVTLPAPVL